MPNYNRNQANRGRGRNTRRDMRYPRRVFDRQPWTKVSYDSSPPRTFYRNADRRSGEERWGDNRRGLENREGRRRYGEEYFSDSRWALDNRNAEERRHGGRYVPHRDEINQKVSRRPITRIAAVGNLEETPAPKTWGFKNVASNSNIEAHGQFVNKDSQERRSMDTRGCNRSEARTKPKQEITTNKVLTSKESMEKTLKPSLPTTTNDLRHKLLAPSCSKVKECRRTEQLPTLPERPTSPNSSRKRLRENVPSSKEDKESRPSKVKRNAPYPGILSSGKKGQQEPERSKGKSTVGDAIAKLNKASKGLAWMYKSMKAWEETFSSDVPFPSRAVMIAAFGNRLELRVTPDVASNHASSAVVSVGANGSQEEEIVQEVKELLAGHLMGQLDSELAKLGDVDHERHD